MNSGSQTFGDGTQSRRFVRFYTWENRKVSSGLPDLLVIGHGGCFCIEVKRKGQRPRQNQREFAEAVAGSLPVYVVTSADQVGSVIEDCVRHNRIRRPRTAISIQEQYAESNTGNDDIT